MYKIIRVWLDSGANIHSRMERSFSTEDVGLTSEEWDELLEDQKEEIVKDYAFERADWGWSD